MIFLALLTIFNFAELGRTKHLVTYKSVPPGNYSSNDISVTMDNITEPWKTTQRTCSVR